MVTAMLALIVPGQDLPWYPTLREPPDTVMTIALPFGSRTSEYQVPCTLAGAPARVGAGACVFGAVRRGAGVVPSAGRVARGLLGLALGRLAGFVRLGLGLAVVGVADAVERSASSAFWADAVLSEAP